MANLDTGNTGFMLLCTSLVMLMTPRLAFIYGGLVGRKNVLTIMMQSFFSMGWTTVVWFAIGYSLCFSGKGPIIGNLDMAFLRGVALDSPTGLLQRNTHFFTVPVGAFAMSSIWAFAFTYGMLWLIDRGARVNVSAAEEELGPDEALHGELAYV